MELDHEKIIHSQLEDPTLTKVCQWVVKGYQPRKDIRRGLSKEVQAYLQYLNVLKEEEDGLLVMQHKDNNRIIIPDNEKLRIKVLDGHKRILQQDTLDNREQFLEPGNISSSLGSTVTYEKRFSNVRNALRRLTVLKALGKLPISPEGMGIWASPYTSTLSVHSL